MDFPVVNDDGMFGMPLGTVNVGEFRAVANGFERQ
jgi:hypothetical protein